MICGTCGTVLPDDLFGAEAKGFCINGHDNWVELRDFDDPDLAQHIGNAMVRLDMDRGTLLEVVKVSEQFAELYRQHRTAKLLLADAADLLDDAVTNHIWDEFDDEGYPLDWETGERADCMYVSTAEEINQFLGRGKVPRGS